MIHGPKEPKTMDHYLKPLVADLNKLFHGVEVNNPNSLFGKTTIRAVISCVVCDLPAVRKICVFLSYNAGFGCSKCLKQFIRSSSKDRNDYSGYDCDQWVKRDEMQHLLLATKAIFNLHMETHLL